MIGILLIALSFAPGISDELTVSTGANSPNVSEAQLLPPLRREYLNTQLNLISNLVCHERMDRFTRRGAGASRWFDSIDADVRVLDDSEEYSDIYQQRPAKKEAKRYKSVNALPGPWQSGELAQLFRIARDQMDRNLPGQRMPAIVEDSTDGQSAVIMEFTVPVWERKWAMRVDAGVFFLSFKMRIWFSRDTGNVLRATWLASNPELPESAGIRAISWDIHFQQASIAGVSSTVPRNSIYTVYYSEAHRRDWVETQFSNFQRYGSETRLRFQDENNDPGQTR